ncbi:MAG: hypothetical protein AAGE43_15680 [Pseudomonadota bacterium]
MATLLKILKTASRLHRRLLALIALLFLMSCGNNSETLDELIAAKAQDLVAANNALVEYMQDHPISPELMEEAAAISEERLRRLEQGKSWEDLDEREMRFKAELDGHREASDRLFSETAQKTVEFYSLLAAVFTYCGEDVGKILAVIDFSGLSLEAGLSGEAGFWDQKAAYNELVKERSSEFECADKVPQIEAILATAQRG